MWEFRESGDYGRRLPASVASPKPVDGSSGSSGSGTTGAYSNEGLRDLGGFASGGHAMRLGPFGLYYAAIHSVLCASHPPPCRLVTESAI